MQRRSVVHRWRVLLACGLVAGLGFVFTAQDFGGGLLRRMWMWELGGILVAVAVALYASLRNLRHRWPAIVALVGALPMTWRVLEAVSHGAPILMFPWFLQMIFFGTVAIIVAAAYSVIVPIKPPPPDDPIPTVRVVG